MGSIQETILKTEEETGTPIMPLRLGLKAEAWVGGTPWTPGETGAQVEAQNEGFQDIGAFRAGA